MMGYIVIFGAGLFGAALFVGAVIALAQLKLITGGIMMLLGLVLLAISAGTYYGKQQVSRFTDFIGD